MTTGERHGKARVRTVPKRREASLELHRPPGSRRPRADTVLIDGAQFADVMIDHGIPVATAKQIELRKVDSD